ncbi:hypothetical protein [Chromatocurvus halotolerans]|uniref:Uncharacterized protein n=1 Tax=Chromatocurvus halotolerans TaxID=1132028 RepID=A0A4R2KXP9_9GAMM|nr:hypothetical protein [Chromatocurvus halotolerans]TCO77852.1 hypothetical protein EV688_102312 [Chromatocurvus halotolerans]
MKKKLLMAAALGELLAALFILELDEYLILAWSSDSLEFFAGQLARYPVFVPAAYFVIYVIVTAPYLPGAALMTLAR